MGVLDEANERDLAACNGDTSRRKYKNFRATVMKLLQDTRPSADNCPVDMKKVTYEVMATYLSCLKTEEDQFKGMSTYDGARSSIMHLMKMDNVYPNHEFKEKICNLLKGFRRTVQQQKVELGLSLDEGKDPLTFAGYNLLCRTFLHNNGSNNEFTFAHCFLTLEWNLMCRADNLVNLNLAHIGWEDDSLLACIAKAKHDQEGEGAKIPWHIYANPSNPYICPVLALGLYLFSHPDLLSNNSFLFTGNHQYRRYTQVLKRAIGLDVDNFRRVGVENESFGSHSLRKGSATFAGSGSTMAPSMASICNRAGWKMGGTRDKYIKFENAGDQYLGRILTGLDALSPSFAVTPPFFDAKSDEEKKKVDEFIKSRIPNAEKISNNLFGVVRYCFASLCYHYSFLTNILQPTSRIRTSAIFMNIPQDIMEMAKVFTYKQVNEGDASCAPRLTGIPPHVVVINNLNEVNGHVSQCSMDVVKELKQELEDRFVGGEKFQVNVMLNQVQQIQHDMQEMLANMKNGGAANGGVRNGSSNEDSVEVGEGLNRRRMYFWGGKFHSVPQGFEVPKMTLGSFITCWYCGCKRDNIPPLRFIQSHDLDKKNGKVLISQWRKMIQYVNKAAARVGYNMPRNRSMGVSDTVDLYGAIRPLFQYESLRINHKRRYDGILWKTVFNIVCKNKGRFADETSN